jgi:predicted metal-binding membrane protein
MAIAVALKTFATPAKQACLNRCHQLPRLSAFCSATVWDSVRYGAMTALWCVGTCWALMLAPMVVDRMHFATMAGVAVVLLVERQAPATRWRLETIGGFSRAGASTVASILRMGGPRSASRKDVMSNEI